MAARKKGLSVEEKRQRMLDLFFEKKEFFQLKELEKVAPKEKGIVMQSVKDILQSLVDDNLVDSDKIGTFMCYWAFPSKAVHNRKRRLEQISEQRAENKLKKESLEQSISDAQNDKEDTEERRELLGEKEKLEQRLTEVDREIGKLSDNDPEVLEKMKKDTEAAKTAANRWTDNIFSIKQWCKRKFAMDGAVLDKQFGIPEDLDYIE